jgi:hypothetical protein
VLVLAVAVVITARLIESVLPLLIGLSAAFAIAYVMWIIIQRHRSDW